jgi:A/G-specific adenine glycosylase
MTEFTNSILLWFNDHGRHDLPWQVNISSYRVWVSEIMLQQTQVATVIPYYHKFMARFPDVETLAAADCDEVLHLWTGLGYYSRARNLHRTAGLIVQNYKGIFPARMADLINLPGIGRSTAGAILAISFDLPVAILDGNVKRVLCRYFAVRGWPGTSKVEKELWRLAEELTPQSNAASYTQAIMDLGATICTRANPLCEACPVKTHCLARQHGIQAELPERKPKKALPLKQTQFAMIENDRGAILLQRRPPTGIWGGLWGFPECPIDTDIADWVKNKFGYDVESVQYTEDIRHTFSHYVLDISPVRMRCSFQVNEVNDSDDYYWYTPGEENRLLGMAAPVKKLVDRWNIE